jgi:hypothetical protein
VIHLDTSVALAALFAEARQPPGRLWRETSIASRLLEYELMVRMHHRGLGASAVAVWPMIEQDLPALRDRVARMPARLSGG